MTLLGYEQNNNKNSHPHTLDIRSKSVTSMQGQGSRFTHSLLEVRGYKLYVPGSCHREGDIPHVGRPQAI